MADISTALLHEVMSVLRHAGRSDLAEQLTALEPVEFMTSTEAARALGLSSPNTAKNWLASGQFPGAFQTAGGHWRFPRAEVEAARRKMQALRDRNDRGDCAPPDEDDDGTPPLL